MTAEPPLPAGARFLLLPVAVSPDAAFTSDYPGQIDGAVAELTQRGDGAITAQIRIPAPEVTPC